MSSKSFYENGNLTFYDSATHERTHPVAPCVFSDDFLGTGIRTTDTWTALDVSTAGDTTPLIAPDVANGVARMPLDSTSEAQRSGLTFGDQRPFILNQGLIWEARVSLKVLPTLLAEAVWGLAGDDNSSADAVAQSIWFKADGGGAIVVENDDGSLTNDDIATGTTVTADSFHIYRIDCSTPSDCRFFIDGDSVATGTTFDISTTPALALQPYFAINKASGAGLGQLEVDYVRVWQNRSA